MHLCPVFVFLLVFTRASSIRSLMMALDLKIDDLCHYLRLYSFMK
jgi:hypothetical protein